MGTAQYEWRNKTLIRLRITQDDNENQLRLVLLDDDGIVIECFRLDKQQAVQIAQALVILQEFL